VQFVASLVHPGFMRLRQRDGIRERPQVEIDGSLVPRSEAGPVDDQGHLDACRRRNRIIDLHVTDERPIPHAIRVAFVRQDPFLRPVACDLAVGRVHELQRGAIDGDDRRRNMRAFGRRRVVEERDLQGVEGADADRTDRQGGSRCTGEEHTRRMPPPSAYALG